MYTQEESQKGQCKGDAAGIVDSLEFGKNARARGSKNQLRLLYLEMQTEEAKYQDRGLAIKRGLPADSVSEPSAQRRTDGTAESEEKIRD